MASLIAIVRLHFIAQSTRSSSKLIWTFAATPLELERLQEDELNGYNNEEELTRWVERRDEATFVPKRKGEVSVALCFTVYVVWGFSNTHELFTL